VRARRKEKEYSGRGPEVRSGREPRGKEKERKTVLKSGKRGMKGKGRERGHA